MGIVGGASFFHQGVKNIGQQADVLIRYENRAIFPFLSNSKKGDHLLTLILERRLIRDTSIKLELRVNNIETRRPNDEVTEEKGDDNNEKENVLNFKVHDKWVLELEFLYRLVKPCFTPKFALHCCQV